MNFYKLQATGNDFVIILDDINISIDVVKICDRNYGIGADGIIIIDQFFNIKIYNSDGSEAPMCGNGLRCVCHLLSFLTSKKEFIVYIDNLPIILKENEKTSSVLMPNPIMAKKDDGYYVNLLNNHFIKIVNDIKKVNFTDKLIKICNDNKCNIHLVQVINKETIVMKTYEYGVCETKSCGSGSMAVFYTLYMLNRLEKKANIIQPGGSVICEVINNKYYLTGEAKIICKGEIINEL